MNDLFTNGLKQQVHPIVRIVVGLILCALGCLASLLWGATHNIVAGITGLLMGLPCIVMGVNLVLGRVQQTKLSSNGIRVCGVIVFIVGLWGIYQSYPVASLLLIFSVSCFKIAKHNRNKHGI